MLKCSCPCGLHVDTGRISRSQGPARAALSKRSQPRACDSGLSMGNLDRLLLVVVC